MYFMAPIQIARHYRLTQEVTPAGTIISVNMVIGVFGGTLLNKVVYKSATKTASFWLRLISILVMLLALAIISKRALEEWRSSKISA